MKKWLLALLVVAAAVVSWGILRKASPPSINFAAVRRTTLVSTLSTNGKAEPFEWRALRAERAGVLSQVAVRDGQPVTQGEAVATISDPALSADLQSAEAGVAEARANLAALEGGGKPAEIAEIDSSLKQAQLQLQQQQKDAAALARLEEKQAATAAEVEAARQKIVQSQAEIQGLEQRRRALVGKTDVAAAQAQLDKAQTSLDLAKRRASQGTVRAPISGIVYGLAVRTGGYVNPGDLLANVGQLDRLRVRVYVDEPELGGVQEGQPVTITWQALPGKQWTGKVERKPASVEALGTRQVGEVICWIDNPGHELLPGTNVDAVIRSAVVPSALVIPKEALRRDAQGPFVFRLVADRVERRTVITGTSSVTEIQVTQGLAEGDAVALPSETVLKAGQAVTPVMSGS